ncbi:DUF1501 domain-containing protein [Blastopirellula sp. JC732]|uniref:DUF1501 domain-containing protein n=1 Tax=Blastopirellula sediminis TaxID=2894196 RepID=A0A9X1MII9_9BACT|nr:DUF1501 domain-containing protein [Blastopirellula sediminis]MCC9609420.1 DUF1501 domain-containing protein [Blastopirellula sediminis]MCC9627803.1 DUF1501 domain-containing protein [Blastopirellula sediminis]
MLNRRQLLKCCSAGFGYLAFAGLAQSERARAQEAANAKPDNPLAPKAAHFPASAKRVIFLCMSGGPSHVDSFDYKPQLAKDHGRRGRYGGSLMKSPWEFRQRGDSGLWISDLFPKVAEHADEMTLIRSMHCDQPLHPGAMTQMHTGTVQFIRPSLGAWTLYGLGTENSSLPGFVSLSAPAGAAQNMGSAFLPAVYGGTKVGRGGGVGQFMPASNQESVDDIKNGRLSSRQQRKQLDLIQFLNREKLEREQYQPAVEGMIESYELAFRMQDTMPKVMDLSDESKATLAMYGADGGPTDAFGKQCLLARRFAEAGVRFIEVTHGGWDQHRNLTEDHKARAVACDQPIAGLLADLKQRNLLDDTLVIWGGEFGRTPAAQGSDGRDHNNKGYTTWMAGGGVKGGFSYGATDEYGYEAVEDKCHIHDWHATILHLMGLDHEKLTYRYAGRDFRLTDVYGNVIKEIVA